MSMKVNKNRKGYPLGVMPEHYPADRVYLDGDTDKTVQGAIDKLTLKSKNITVTSNADGRVDLSLAYPSNIVVAVVEIGGYKIIPYSYQNGWFAVLCDNSGGTAFNSAPNMTVTLTVFYITNG